MRPRRAHRPSRRRRSRPARRPAPDPRRTPRARAATCALYRRARALQVCADRPPRSGGVASPPPVARCAIGSRVWIVPGPAWPYGSYWQSQRSRSSFTTLPRTSTWSARTMIGCMDGCAAAVAPCRPRGRSASGWRRRFRSRRRRWPPRCRRCRRSAAAE